MKHISQLYPRSEVVKKYYEWKKKKLIKNKNKVVPSNNLKKQNEAM